jgi:hypothetical protein
VGSAAGAGGAGAPGIPAQQHSRSGARRGCGRGHGPGWRARRRAGVGSGRCSGTRARASRGLRARLRAGPVGAGADGGRHGRGAGQPQHPATVDGLRVAVAPVGRRCVHDGHDTKVVDREAGIDVLPLYELGRMTDTRGGGPAIARTCRFGASPAAAHCNQPFQRFDPLPRKQSATGRSGHPRRRRAGWRLTYRPFFEHDSRSYQLPAALPRC